MSLNDLFSLGFSREEIKKLEENEWFSDHVKKRGEDLGILIGTIERVYGDEERFKRAILNHPQFAGYDHARVVRQGVEVYGDEERFKRAILNHPQFAGYDHARVVRQGVEVYGDEERVKKAVLSFPQFAGLDHARVVRQKSKLGKLVGLSQEEVLDIILKKPINAGYSFKRDLACIDIGRTLKNEGFEQNIKMVKIGLNLIALSPYVPIEKRKRISKSNSKQEPKLLKELRKRLIRK
jgi:hypothetical protein